MGELEFPLGDVGRELSVSTKQGTTELQLGKQRKTNSFPAARKCQIRELLQEIAQAWELGPAWWPELFHFASLPGWWCPVLSCDLLRLEVLKQSCALGTNTVLLADSEPREYQCCLTVFTVGSGKVVQLFLQSATQCCQYRRWYAALILLTPAWWL